MNEPQENFVPETVNGLTGAMPNPTAGAPEAPVIPVAAAYQQDEGAKKIEQIRDILFGSNMRDYETRFSRLEEHLGREAAAIRDATRQSFEKLEAFVKEELRVLHGRVDQEQHERTGAHEALDTQLKTAAETIHGRIAEVHAHHTEAAHNLNEALLNQGKELHDRIQSTHHEIQTLLEARFNELRQDKTDRSALAALFTEVAARLHAGNGSAGTETKVQQAGQ